MQQQLAVDVADLRIAIGRIDTRLQEIHEEVDRPLLSELWFGFISDRFTAVLNRMFGFDTGPSTPLWAAGALSLTLVLLKFLLWFANRFDEKSAVARVLGRTFGAVVTVYLILLTVSLFALAASAPGSRLDDYADQVAASEELLTAMGAVDQRVGTLLARLDAEAARTTAVAQAGAVLPPAGAEVATLVDLATRSEKLTAESLAGMASMQDALTRLSQSVDDINRSQHGVAWTWLVGVAALCSLATAVLLWNLHLTK